VESYCKLYGAVLRLPFVAFMLQGGRAEK